MFFGLLFSLQPSQDVSFLQEIKTKPAVTDNATAKMKMMNSDLFFIIE